MIKKTTPPQYCLVGCKEEEAHIVYICGLEECRDMLVVLIMFSVQEEFHQVDHTL